MLCVCLTFFNPLVSMFFVKAGLFRRKQTWKKKKLKVLDSDATQMIFIWLLKMVWQVHKLYWRRSCTESWVIICGMRCILFYGLDLFASFQHMHILIYISMSLPLSFPLLLYPLGPVPQVREETGVSGERRANGEMAAWIRKVSSTVSIWSNSSTKHRAKCMIFFNIFKMTSKLLL